MTPRDHARALFATRPHWSMLAAALGAIEDVPGEVRGWGYITVREWAAAELDLSDSGYESLSRLWAGMRRHPTYEWGAVPRSRAATLVRILDDGGDRDLWMERAASASKDTWETLVRETYGKPEPWVVWRVRLPRESVQVRDAALAVAAKACDVPADRIHDPAVTHGLLEWCFAQVLSAA